jgi:hypothetical protein
MTDIQREFCKWWLKVKDLDSGLEEVDLPDRLTNISLRDLDIALKEANKIEILRKSTPLGRALC